MTREQFLAAHVAVCAADRCKKYDRKKGAGSLHSLAYSRHRCAKNLWRYWCGRPAGCRTVPTCKANKQEGKGVNAIQRKRAEYERQVAAIQAKLAVLAELEAELGETPATPAPPVTVAIAPPLVSPPVLTTPVTAAEVPAGNAPAPSQREPPPPAPAARRTPPAADDTRRKLLLLLYAHPAGLKVSELSQQSGAGYNIVSYNLKHEWFRKSDPSYVRSPWVLTEAGEKAAIELNPATARGT